MNFWVAILALGITCAIVWGVQPAHGAQLASIINPNEDSAEFTISYLRTAHIDYDDGGQVAELLRGKSWVIDESAQTPEPDAVALMNALNQKIISDGSGAQISDLKIDYSATLTGRESNAAVDYKILLKGTLTNHIIGSTGAGGKILVDLGWRGLTVTGPVMLNGVEINIPTSVIMAQEPSVYSHMQGSAAEKLLGRVLIDAEGIKDQGLPNWHFLFDPTGIGVDAATFGLSDDISGHVVSGFTMGESGIREGRQVETVLYEEFVSDKTYGIETLESADSANLSIVGFATIDRLDELEIVGVTPTAPDGYSVTTGEFPVTIIYGMAGLAAVGGIGFFIFSSRQLKREGSDQTGIDPSMLRGYQTSASAGGYQTNRGEAQLADSADYAQTRSVYDNAEAKSPETPALSSSEASCGCVASADSGVECDCQMQGQCFCDATCGCNGDVCRDAVKDMQ